MRTILTLLALTILVCGQVKNNAVEIKKYESPRGYNNSLKTNNLDKADYIYFSPVLKNNLLSEIVFKELHKATKRVQIIDPERNNSDPEIKIFGHYDHFFNDVFVLKIPQINTSTTNEKIVTDVYNKFGEKAFTYQHESLTVTRLTSSYFITCVLGLEGLSLNSTLFFNNGNTARVSNIPVSFNKILSSQELSIIQIPREQLLAIDAEANQIWTKNLLNLNEYLNPTASISRQGKIFLTTINRILVLNPDGTTNSEIPHPISVQNGLTKVSHNEATILWVGFRGRRAKRSCFVLEYDWKNKKVLWQYKFQGNTEDSWLPREIGYLGRDFIYVCFQDQKIAVLDIASGNLVKVLDIQDKFDARNIKRVKNGIVYISGKEIVLIKQN